MLRDLMMRLVVPSDSGDPVRTRAPRRSVAADEEHETVIESLVGARLLSSDGDTVEIAHEALVMAWPRLRSWLDDDVEGLRIMRHLAVAADSWEDLGRPPGELYRGPRQAKAEQWRTGSTPTLTATELDFLDESAAMAEAEARATEEQVRRERRSNQRLRAGLAAVAVLLAVAIVAGAIAKTAADRAEQQSVAADARRLGAEALRTRSLDLALLLAVAGTDLDDSPDTRNSLRAVLDRAPELIGVARTTTEPIDGAVRPDGRTVATTGWDAGVTIVDTDTRKEVAHNDDIPLFGVRFNPNGTQLAAAVNVSTPSGERRVDPLSVRMLDPQTAALASQQLGGLPEGRVVQTSLAFSGDGRRLAAGFVHPIQLDEETWVRVWDTADLARPVAAFVVPFPAEEFALSHDGTRLYLVGDDSAFVVDAATGRVIRSAPGIQEIALSADGSTLAAVRGREVALLDAERLTLKSAIEEDGDIDELMLSVRGGKLGYTVDNTLVVRSLAEPDAAGLRISGPEAGLTGIGFSPDGRTLYSRGGGRVLVWDLVGDRRFVRSVPVQPQSDSAEIFEAEVSPDGRTVANLVSGDPESYGVHLLDVRSGTRTPQPALRPSNAYYLDLAWRPDGKVVASAQNDQWVDLWDGATGQAAGQHRVPDRFGVVESVTFSGDSARLVVGTHQGWVYSVDASSLELLGMPVRVKADVPMRGIATNGDGARALVWIDRKLQLLDLEAGRVLERVDPGFAVASWAWSPDGKTVVVVGSDPAQDGHAMVALLDPQTLATRSRFTGPEVVVGAIQFSSDGQWFTTSGPDRVGLWDSPTGASLGSVRSDEGSLAGFGRGTSEVLIASPSGEVSVWDPRPEAAVTAACRIASREMTESEWRTYLPERERRPVCGS
jgi:WD40 repeat protein